jgi:hypothetical protein
LLAGICALFHEHLDEGTLILRMLPRQRFLASGNLDHEIPYPLRFPRLHHEVLGQVVALVENAECDDAVLVRRADLLALRGLGGPGLHARYRVRNTGLLSLRGRLAAARRKQQRKAGRQQISGSPLHAPSSALW